MESKILEVKGDRLRKTILWASGGPDVFNKELQKIKQDKNSKIKE